MVAIQPVVAIQVNGRLHKGLRPCKQGVVVAAGGAVQCEFHTIDKASNVVEAFDSPVLIGRVPV